MNEILLTESEIDVLLDRAWVEVYGGTECVDRRRSKEVIGTAQLLCRAQVRKIAEWLEYALQSQTDRDFAAATLKAAGGEG